MDPVVTLTEEELVVEPGGDVSTVVRIRNTSEVVEEYELSVLGEVAAYTEIIPAQVSAYVGEVAEATVIIRPPYDTMISSGQIPFGIRAQSREDADRLEVAEGELTVGAINLVQTKLIPARSSGRLRAKARIEIHNRGTEEATVRLRTVDPDGKLSFALAPREVDIAPDATAESFLKIRPRKNVIMGKPVHHTFQLSYRRKAGVRDAYLGATTGGDTEAFVDSVFEQKPIVAKWMIGLTMLVVLIAGLFVFRAQTADIVVAVPNPVRAPNPPTAMTVDSSVDALRISWEPPVPAPSGYTVISADPELYAQGIFDPGEALDPLGPQERSFPLDVEGGSAKCLFIQSFIDDPEKGRTNSVIVGLASPDGLVTTGVLPAGNCVTAETAQRCDPPVVADPVPSPGDPNVWSFTWTYGDGCDTAGEADWTVFVNNEESVSPDGAAVRDANVDLTGVQPITGQFEVRVSPGEGLPETVYLLEAGVVEEERERFAQAQEEANQQGRAPDGSYALVIGLAPSSQFPPTAEPGELSVADFLQNVFGLVTFDSGLGIEEGRVHFGPVDPAVEVEVPLETLRLPGVPDDEIDTRKFYLYVEGFPSRDGAISFCDSIQAFLDELTGGEDWAEAFPLANPPPPCRAVA